MICNTVLSPCEQSKQGGRKFNLKKKSTHTRLWCERICLSVSNFDLNYLRTGKIEWAVICPKSGWQGPGQGPKKQPYL